MLVWGVPGRSGCDPVDPLAAPASPPDLVVCSVVGGEVGASVVVVVVVVVVVDDDVETLPDSL